MFLERQTVSRKTPGDGKLEISAAAAERLTAAATMLQVQLGERRAPCRVETLACTCQKVGRSHEHHFVASELLKALRAATQVELHLDEHPGIAEACALLTILPAD